MLATTGVLKIALRVDDVPVPDATIRLGRTGAPAAGPVVDLANAELDGAPSAPAAADDVVVELWRTAAVAAAARPAPSLDDATREPLRQLGYVE